MRILLLLLLAFVPLTETKPMDEVLLKEIIGSVREIQNWKDPKSQILHQHVKMLPVDCSNKTFCQAAVILKGTNLNHTMLVRQLFAYAGHHNCSVSSSEEYTMRALLRRIQHCSQIRNTSHKRTKK